MGENYSGQYIGFGTGENGDSSAIVVNGTGTDIDLSGLINLTLAGNTYIATKTAKDNLTGADGNPRQRLRPQGYPDGAVYCSQK